MSPVEAIVAADAGSSGCRALLFDLGGRKLAHAHQPYASDYLPDGGVEQDAETWWEALCATIRAALAQTPNVRPLALGLTSKRSSVIPLGPDGSPLRKAILWQDRRTRTQCAELDERLGAAALYERTGLVLHTYFTLPKLLWLRDHEPDLLHRTATFAMVHDFLVGRLTGQVLTDPSQASRTMLYDLGAGAWAQDLCEAAGARVGQMPQIMPPGSVVGTVTPQAANRTSLPEGLPVVSAGGDQQAAALGTGADVGGVISVVTGTGSFVVAPVDAPRLHPERRTLCTAHVIPGQFTCEAGIFTTGAVYRWLRNLLWHPDVHGTTKGESARDPYERLNELLSRTPPGAHGLVLVPHFTGSAAPYWDPEATGVLVGLTPGHGPGHLARAVAEGVACEIAKNLAEIESLGAPVRELRASGGAYRSRAWLEIQANVFERPVVKNNVEETAALGAAVLAATAIGAHASLEAAREAMVRPQMLAPIVPDPKAYPTYRRLRQSHNRVYEALREAGIFSDIARESAA